MGTATVLGSKFAETVFEAAFIALLLLLLGDAVHLRRRARGSSSHVEPKTTRMERLREQPWNVRVALLLVAAWAVWLLAFVAWGWTIPEWQDGNFYFGYTVMSVALLVPVVIGVAAAARRPGWREIAGGIVVAAVAVYGCERSVTELKQWGEIVVGLNEDRGTGWVPLDSLDFVPYWALLAAGVLLVVGGIAHLVHPAHGTTPHAGAAA